MKRRRSSRKSANGNCVGGVGMDSVFLARDIKDRGSGSVCCFTANAWTPFTRRLTR
jgi:hypothetical protein